MTYSLTHHFNAS